MKNQLKALFGKREAPIKGVDGKYDIKSVETVIRQLADISLVMQVLQMVTLSFKIALRTTKLHPSSIAWFWATTNQTKQPLTLQAHRFALTMRSSWIQNYYYISYTVFFSEHIWQEMLGLSLALIPSSNASQQVQNSFDFSLYLYWFLGEFILYVSFSFLQNNGVMTDCMQRESVSSLEAAFLAFKGAPLSDIRRSTRTALWAIDAHRMYF